MAVLLWLFVLFGVSANAQSTRSVCASGCSHTTIKQAYDASASSGDTIDVQDSRIYTESFDIKKSITIQTSLTSPATWRNNGSKDDIFRVRDGEIVVVEGFILVPRTDHAVRVHEASTLTLRSVTVDTFSNTGQDGVGVEAEDSSVLTIEDSTFNNLSGRDGGAIHGNNGTTVSITNTSFDGNEASSEGGTIAIIDGSLTVTNCSFDDSEADVWGGTIYAEDSTLVISGSTFGTSVVTDGGSVGGHIATWSDDWTFDSVTITNSNFSSGESDAEGGSLYLTWADIAITGSTFTSNLAGADGGGAYLLWVRTGRVATSSFISNRSDDDGGGLFVRDDPSTSSTSMDIEANVFRLNEALDNGGGLRVQDFQNVTVTGNTFSDNTAANSGGAMNALNMDIVTLNENEFIENEADQGGALRLDNVSDVAATRGYYCGNSALSNGGGALWVNNGGGTNSQFTNNIFSENSSSNNGGAIYVINHDPEFINNSFLANNASGDGGAAYFSNSDYTFVNNLVAWTAGGDGIDASWSGGSTYTMDYNNWYLNTTNDFAGSLNSSSAGTNSLFVDPLLEDYTIDGDCTNDEMWPSTISPLINAGDPDTALNDPDGTRSDIGAYGGPNADADLFTDNDGDGYVAIYDCDDGDAAINPGATEICDALNVDENCNGLADDDDSTVDVSTQSNWYEDGDKDSYGAIGAMAVTSCDDPSDATTAYSDVNTDCNDADDTINPGATEVCDAADVDENCNGLADDDDSGVDVGSQTAWYPDTDTDTFGDAAAAATLACDDPSTMSTDYVNNNGDCDDGDTGINPSATEQVGDGVDQDCDGGEVCYVDSDGDSYRPTSGTTVSSDADCTDAGEATNMTPSGDCNDMDSAINPGASEVCDSQDNNCDGVVDEDTAIDAPTWYEDADTDSYGSTSVTKTSCAAPTGYIATTGDCDDTNGAIYPGADEYCDGVDTDCDGTLDEDDALDALTWYADTDGDLYGDIGSTTKACSNPSGYVSDNTDCDDTEVTTYPGANEYCDSVDNDCDSVIDEDDAVDAKTWYIDDDGDTYGVSTTTTRACAQPTGYADNDTDCNDGNSAINPGATEICDAADVDENCNGLADDLDSGVDPSTQTTWYPDNDKDTYGQAGVAGKLACDDPSTMTRPYVLSNTDCDDTDNAVNPGATEVCDTIDNDCDGVIDEDDAVGAPTWYLDDDGDGYGVDTDTTVACDEPEGFAEFDGDCDDTSEFTYPGATELCDDADNDCDDVVDEDIEVVEWFLDSDGDSFGTIDDVVEDCAPVDGRVLDNTDCDDGVFEINPAADEIWYDGVDQDCDGWSDFDQDFDGFDSDAYDGTDCDDLDAEINPDAEEVWYDGVDQDCDDWSDFDQDRDGYDAAEYDGEDCDDDSADINPGVDEVPDNLIDENCDEELGWTPGDDRNWSPEEDGRVGEGCNCDSTSSWPGSQWGWLFTLGFAVFTLRRRTG